MLTLIELGFVTKMRPSLPRLVRILPRNSLASEGIAYATPIPEPTRSDIKPTSLIQVLLRRKTDQGPSYPPNIRIEPVVRKKVLKDVPARVRQELLSVAKER